MSGTMGDIHPVEDFHHLPLAFGLPAAKINQRQFHILEDCQLVYQVETLEYETDIPFTESRQLALSHLVYLLAVKEIFAGSRRIKRSQDIQ